MKKAVFCAIASLAALVSSAEDAYVESDGTQYLDTGYCFGPNTKIELDCQLTEVEDGKSLIGTYPLNPEAIDPSKPRFNIYVGQTHEEELRFSLETSDSSGARQALNNLAADTKRHLFVVDFPAEYDNFKIYTDGEVSFASGSSYASHPSSTSSLPVALFAIRTASIGIQSKSKMKVYGLKMSEKENGEYVLKKNFMPLVKDGVAGLMETVSGEFFPATEGALECGGEILYSGTASPYIESEGEAAFNTGYMVGPNTKILLDFKLANANNYSCAMFGILNPDEDTVSGNKIYCRAYIGDGTSTAGNDPELCFTGAYKENFGTNGKSLRKVKKDNRYTFIMDFPATADQFRLYDHEDMTNVYKSGSSDLVTVTNGTNTACLPLGLFNFCNLRHASSTNAFPNANRAKMKVFGMKFYEKEGDDYVLKKDLVPCLKGGIPGFKDSVSGLFSTGVDISKVKYGGDILVEKDDAHIDLKNDISNGQSGASLRIETGYTVSKNTRVELDYALLTGWSSASKWSLNPFLFSASYMDLWVYGKSDGCYAFTLGDNSTQYYSANRGDVANMSVATAYGIRRTAAMNSNSVWFVTAGYTNAMTTVSTAVSAKTGLLRIGSDSSNLRYLPIRVYGLRIYESDAPTRNYVPIVTNGVPGLVDTIGGGVIYPKTYNGSDYRCLVAEAGGNFANCTDGSDEAYLEFPGTGSGISTGIKITPESCVEADFSLWNTYKLASGNEWIINQDSGCYLALAAAADNNFWWQYCDYPASGSPSTVSSGVSVQNVRLQWKFDSPNNLLTVRRGGTLLKNIEITSTRTRTDGKDNKITIGQSNAHMRLYSFKITTAGNVVRDYIPYVTNGVAGLYDLCGKKFYPLSGGKVSGAKRGGVTYQERPFAVYGKSGGAVTATISCKAAGAQSYQWYMNGELLAGETSDEIVVTKASQGGSNSAVYSVRPVYEVFNETDVGEEATITVTLPVSGLMTIFK